MIANYYIDDFNRKIIGSKITIGQAVNVILFSEPKVIFPPISFSGKKAFACASTAYSFSS
jgi:hypothetical protein